MSKKLELEKTPIWKLLIKYAVPSIIASSFHALYNIVDRIYIGKALGAKALAGITLTFPVFILSIALGVLIGTGSAAMISIKLGQNKKESAEKILGNTFGMFFVMGIFVTVLGIIFLEPILYLLGASSETFPYAYGYLMYFLPFMATDFLAMGTNGSIRSEGNPIIAMKIVIIGALLNIVLDPIFLFVFKMGVEGTAIATVIARVIAASLVIWHFTRSKKRVLTLKVSNIIPQWSNVKQILSIGVSPFTMCLSTTFIAAFLNRALVSEGGDIAIGALGVIQSIFVIMETPLRGLVQGAQPIIGHSFGANKTERLRETLKYSFIYSFIISISGLAIIYGASDFLISMFSKGNIELIKVGGNGLKIFMAMIPCAAIHMSICSYFEAVGNANKAIVLNLLRKVLIFLPALWIMKDYFGLNGVWSATPIADFASFLIALIFIKNSLNKDKNKEERTLELNAEAIV